MESGKYISVMAEFITGNIVFFDFKDFVDERLFELRKKPEMTEEKKILSSIELYLHEAEEKTRDENEVYARVQFILDNIILAKPTGIGETQYFSCILNKPYYISGTLDESPNTEPAIIKELTAPL
jgi:hypothetical protein